MPIDDLVIAFWKTLKDDLDGRGCTCNEIPYRYRRFGYQERVTIERGMLQENAREFVDSPEFDIWSRLSGFAPDDLRRRFNECNQ